MDKALLIGGIIVAVLFLFMNKDKLMSACGQRRQAPRLPRVHCVNLPTARPVSVEGSLGPTPYREDGVRAPGPTEHSKNKTEGMWRSGLSQAPVDENTGMSLNAITSEYLTPVRKGRAARSLAGPRMRDTMRSHV